MALGFLGHPQDSPVGLDRQEPVCGNFFFLFVSMHKKFFSLGGVWKISYRILNIQKISNVRDTFAEADVFAENSISNIDKQSRQVPREGERIEGNERVEYTRLSVLYAWAYRNERGARWKPITNIYKQVDCFRPAERGVIYVYTYCSVKRESMICISMQYNEKCIA